MLNKGGLMPHDAEQIKHLQPYSRTSTITGVAHEPHKDVAEAS